MGNKKEHSLQEESNKLNVRQIRFCELYVRAEFFGNGVEAYAAAYDIEKTGNWYKSAATCASRLLRNVEIIAAINKNLEEQGLNDAFVDKQLLFLITQHSDFGVKLGAIREYNALKQRIKSKLEVSVDEELKNLYKTVMSKRD